MTRETDPRRDAGGPYGSARDIPSIRQMLHDLQGMKTLTTFIARDQRAVIEDLDRQVKHHAELVDAFYGILGERNWIFHDDLDLTLVEGLVRLPAEQAERALIDSYMDPEAMRFKVRRLGRFAELRARMPLLERAAADFYGGRYYSTVLVLLSVMDGFVNELDPGNRKGLHAREADEVQAWDSVVGHHLGLTHAHRSFTKTFRRRSDAEVTELHRHGIIHGMLTNFDNDVVAAKAWNRMFAVADWATSMAKQRVPPKPKPKWRDTLRQIAKNAETHRALDAWRPSKIAAGGYGFESDEAVRLSRSYFEAWMAGNYGSMAGFLSPLVADSTPGKTAGSIREAFTGTTLSAFSLTRVACTAAAIALVDADLTIDQVRVPCRLRWIRSGDDGMGIAPNEEGSWKLITWAFEAMRSERTYETN